MQRFTGILGILVVMAVAYLFSNNRRAIQPRVIYWGLGLQIGFAVLVLKTPVAEWFKALSGVINQVLGYSIEGSRFVFGDKLGAPNDQFGVVFAFQVLPIVIFIASLFAILYYLGVMQIFVRAMALVMQKVMRTSGAESTSVAASIFMGQTEAPLTIRPFLAGLTQSELFTVMTSGMAHISGSVMAAYVLIAHVEFQHLLTAVIMTAPATLMLAKVLMPETETPATAGSVKIEVEKPGVNLIDAAARGAWDGMQLALNVGAMLIAFIALIALANGILGAIHNVYGFGWLPPTMQGILGHIFAPVAWIMGVRWADANTVSNLLGTRLILNEFVAYVDLGKLTTQMDHKSFVIATELKFAKPHR